ncbi:uncharacterized protein ASCRUDRAFT_67427 [Ascoidea rubescens DSM 1968]|uniref:WHIM1 domain-containing protein n=1 Tax=Ascoidea rubescens DSM 1968 TaxID=1344418 RepID=A0A1D2VNX5_9ASCO|nr:hypothetical protein ASCRUDRAFT_67427 [Ascoidea rubescens DSM 1968]ODV63310.1 hypothetical protein ASCRUDRAFT_67427 [Ascoidea rubescens DSM 1968]
MARVHTEESGSGVAAKKDPFEMLGLVPDRFRPKASAKPHPRRRRAAAHPETTPSLTTFRFFKKAHSSSIIVSSTSPAAEKFSRSSFSTGNKQDSPTSESYQLIEIDSDEDAIHDENHATQKNVRNLAFPRIATKNTRRNTPQTRKVSNNSNSNKKSSKSSLELLDIAEVSDTSIAEISDDIFNETFDEEAALDEIKKSIKNTMQFGKRNVSSSSLNPNSNSNSNSIKKSTAINLSDIDSDNTLLNAVIDIDMSSDDNFNSPSERKTFLKRIDSSTIFKNHFQNQSKKSIQKQLNFLSIQPNDSNHSNHSNHSNNPTLSNYTSPFKKKTTSPSEDSNENFELIEINYCRNSSSSFKLNNSTFEIPQNVLINIKNHSKIDSLPSSLIYSNHDDYFLKNNTKIVSYFQSKVNSKRLCLGYPIIPSIFAVYIIQILEFIYKFANLFPKNLLYIGPQELEAGIGLNKIHHTIFDNNDSFINKINKKFDSCCNIDTQKLKFLTSQSTLDNQHHSDDQITSENNQNSAETSDQVSPEIERLFSYLLSLVLDKTNIRNSATQKSLIELKKISKNLQYPDEWKLNSIDHLNKSNNISNTTITVIDIENDIDNENDIDEENNEKIEEKWFNPFTDVPDFLQNGLSSLEPIDRLIMLHLLCDWAIERSTKVKQTITELLELQSLSKLLTESTYYVSRYIKEGESGIEAAVKKATKIKNQKISNQVLVENTKIKKSVLNKNASSVKSDTKNNNINENGKENKNKKNNTQKIKIKDIINELSLEEKEKNDKTRREIIDKINKLPELDPKSDPLDHPLALRLLDFFAGECGPTGKFYLVRMADSQSGDLTSYDEFKKVIEKSQTKKDAIKCSPPSKFKLYVNDVSGMLQTMFIENDYHNWKKKRKRSSTNNSKKLEFLGDTTIDRIKNKFLLNPWYEVASSPAELSAIIEYFERKLELDEDTEQIPTDQLLVNGKISKFSKYYDSIFCFINYLKGMLPLLTLHDELYEVRRKKKNMEIDLDLDEGKSIAERNITNFRHLRTRQQLQNLRKKDKEMRILLESDIDSSGEDDEEVDNDENNSFDTDESKKKEKDRDRDRENSEQADDDYVSNSDSDLELLQS